MAMRECAFSNAPRRGFPGPRRLPRAVHVGAPRIVVAVYALVWLVVLVGCAGSARPLRPPPNNGNDTSLGSGDVFDVRIFGEQELSASYRVAEDGTIDFPLIGRIEVVGLEPPATADLLRDRLRDGRFMLDPQVSVFVREYNSKRVSVMGAVSRPGTFPMSSGLTVVQAISLAGGFTPLAMRSGPTITRQENGHARSFRVPVDEIVQGRAEDVLLQAGDIVYVPERVF